MRLNLECHIPTHHRGVRIEQAQAPPNSQHSISPPRKRARTNDADASPSHRSDLSSSASVNPFSVQSLLDTTSSETTGSKALLSSTSFAHIQQQPSVKVSTPSASQSLIEHVTDAGLFDESEVKELIEL